MLGTSVDTDKNFLGGGEQLGKLMLDFNWTNTPLGPIESWPQSLRTAVNLILNSQHPMWIGWGTEITFLYNDAYIQVLSAAKHPWALGRSASEVWAEIWDFCGPLADKVFDQGVATYMENVRLLMNRGDFLEETYYSFSYSPIYDEDGKVAGLFCPSAETTTNVLHTRRLATLSELSSHALLEKTTRGACAAAFQTLRNNADDIPFAALYLTNHSRTTLVLEEDFATGASLKDFIPSQLGLEDKNEGDRWPLAEVMGSGTARLLSFDDLNGVFTGCADLPVKEAILLPLSSAANDQPLGVLIAGINPCRRIDEDYRRFFDLLAGHIAMAVRNARAAEEEKQRIEALAELDRAKTVFFSNVSHEFRTPLTLMLGPIEKIMTQASDLLPAEDREGLSVTHRNALRLLRLVNALLDFSRIESGRISAHYTPTKLGSYTADIASNFRSVIEQAGLDFLVHCEEIDEAVYVDRDMWEKIVFNLLSNAFKFTLHGEVEIRLYRNEDHAVLVVRDSGIGIPEEEIPNLFQRFHRVRTTVARTFEGSGIGLSLVRELVNLHHGTIAVSSKPGRGTTFTVTVPLGKDHLSQNQIVEIAGPVRASGLANVYVKEIESLMGHHDGSPVASSPAADISNKSRILVVDDNADMRKYIAGMLHNDFVIEDAPNGREALFKISSFDPDLIISDIMMPEMDGVEFLQTIKRTPAWAKIPVILLSARAGEEARIEGYELGADDYLVKPFSANELQARIRAQLRIGKARHHAETHLRNLFQQAPVIIVVFRGPEFIVEIANKKLLEYWGKSLEEVLDKPFLEVMPEVSTQGLIELLRKVLTTGERQVENEREVPFWRNGRYETTYVSYVYEPLRNEEGNITHVMVVAHEVTDSVRARKRVEASETKFRNLVVQSPIGIAILRKPNFLVEVANESYLRIAGRSAEELVGKPFFDVLVELRESVLVQLLSQVLETGEPYVGAELPVDFYRNDTLVRAYFNFVYQPLIEDGEVTGVIGSVMDVTEIVKARQIAQDMAAELEQRVIERTEELMIANEKLEASNRELEQFAYIASHDLQEPLRKIQIFSELLQNNMDDRAVVARYIQKIESSAARMSVLIHDILHYSRASREGEAFEAIDLNHVLRNVLVDLELNIQETGAEIDANPLPVINGNPQQIHQLFANLIGNALKFRRGKPVVRIRADEAKSGGDFPRTLVPDRQYYALTFSDNGIGFKQEYAEKIFVIFQRLNHDGQEGTGIGLAICKRIAENHGGTIQASGEPDQGATFTVWLPVA